MNFGRRGIRNRQEYLASKSRKRLKKVMLGAGQLLLVAFIGLGVIGAALGLGVFRGVIDSAPSQTVIDVSPKGFSSFVYDAKNNQVAKLVSADSRRVSWPDEYIICKSDISYSDEFLTFNNSSLAGNRDPYRSAKPLFRVDVQSAPHLFHQFFTDRES